MTDSPRRLPTHVTAREIAPGDVVVLEAGDTRQVHRRELLAHELVSVDWGDGRHSLLDSERVVVLLHSGLPPKVPPAVLESPTDTSDNSLGGEA